MLCGITKSTNTAPPGFVGLSHYFHHSHAAGDRGGVVQSLSFIDDVTWVARGKSVAEARVELKRTVRRAINWSRMNGVSFDVAKTETIISPRNRRHCRDRTQERIPVGTHQVPFNTQATRWLGIYLDSRPG